MKYVDEFRDPEMAKSLTRGINELAERISKGRQQPIQIMEFCGGHTHTIFRYGIEQLLPDSIEMVHGPGCPVCVLPMGRVDDCVALAMRLNLPGKNMLVSHIIGDCAEEGGVVAEVKGWQAGPTRCNRVLKLDRDMRGVAT